MEKCFRYAVQVWYLEENYHRTISFIETFGRYLWIPSSVHMCVPGNSMVAVAQATAKRSSISSSVMSFASILLVGRIFQLYMGDVTIGIFLFYKIDIAKDRLPLD